MNDKVSPEHPWLTSRFLPIPKPFPIFEVSAHIDDERGTYPSASQDGSV